MPAVTEYWLLLSALPSTVIPVMTPHQVASSVKVISTACPTLLSVVSAASAGGVLEPAASSANTVTIKSLVSLASPAVIIAVNVTHASGCPAAGRVTLPSLLITSVLPDVQVTVASFWFPGNVRSAFTAFISPRVKLALATATFSASVSPPGFAVMVTASANAAPFTVTLPSVMVIKPIAVTP